MKIEQFSYYHLYNRGNNKDIVFFEHEDYHYFLKQFEKYLHSSCQLYAYCLMPNHFHFFLQVLDCTSFNKGIKNMLISYSRTINIKYGRVGSLFQGRYKAQEINSDTYFSRVVTYIHQNPVAAGIVNKLEDYPYSSYHLYLSPQQTILHKEKIIDWFNDLEDFIAAHQY